MDDELFDPNKNNVHVLSYDDMKDATDKTNIVTMDKRVKLFIFDQPPMRKDVEKKIMTYYFNMPGYNCTCLYFSRNHSSIHPMMVSCTKHFITVNKPPNECMERRVSSITDEIIIKMI